MTASDLDRPGLTVVVPAFNEAARLPATLTALAAGMDSAAGGPWEVIVADDGSSDATLAIATAAADLDPRIRVVALDGHRGKGAALARGFDRATHDLVLFVDADLPIPVATFADLVGQLGGADIVAGTRKRGRTVRAQPMARRVGGRLFRLAIAALGLTTTSDPQCGVKLLRRGPCAPVVAAVRSQGFAFDVELLRRAATAGLSVAETPVEWSHVPGSSIRPIRDALRTLAELAAVRRLLR